jgi:hypothetical protein
MCIHTDKIKARREARKEYQKAWRLKNKDKLAEHRLKNKDKIAEYQKAWRLKNKDKLAEGRKGLDRREYQKGWRLKNKDKIAEYGKAYQKTHKHDRREWWRGRRKVCEEFRIVENLRQRLWYALKSQSTRRSASTLALLGCSSLKLKEHLEAKFTTGMNWDNYGLYGWHIDHIKPCAKFNLTLDSEQKLCFHYTNLQPLWAEDNLRKSDKY